MSKLLTKKDLAERWQLDERTIDRYRMDGIIVPVKGLPCVRYNESYIEQIEGNIPERTTTRERRLEKELQELTAERDELMSIIRDMLISGSKIMNKAK